MTESWRPTASIERLRRRAELIALVRGFFTARGLWEVDTPVLSRAAISDPNIRSMRAEVGGEQHLWLQTSPEAAMKRLLCADSGSIFQISHAFRAGERGRLHNPEFTLLEWYRVGFDHHDLMEEVAELVGELIDPRPLEWLSYREAFARYLELDPYAATSAQFAARAEAAELRAPDLGEDRDAWCDLLLSHLIAPQLGRERFTFLHDFPASQAALARLHEVEGVEVAERFELFVDGIEIANGYHELADHAEQQRRFEAERVRREAAGEPAAPVDERLLAALAEGLPGCAGVALGLDRLIMLSLGAERIEEVIAFPSERA